ncbi:MAG: hypothetical protein KME42_26485 [Tildeniella nuda ZEHNDER 1965/U140]|jgi:hypothetical protein|nr:hypothetical protein [Tildeniella nuda ZEHNDER 1965/U140]
MPRILFLHPNQQDYLAEGVFHGLRTLLGADCVDIPRYDCMYKPLTHNLRIKLRGNGFTLYGLLPEIPELSEDRFFWENEIDKYDYIIVANLTRQWHQVMKLSPNVNPEKLILLDGEDQSTCFPFEAMRRRLLKDNPLSFFTPSWKYRCFKRELIGEGYSYGLLTKFLPSFLRRNIPLPDKLMSISFSIPEEKISLIDLSRKKKDFPVYIVDSEVSKQVKDSFFGSLGAEQYSFDKEEDYYDDLRKSRYGITTKREGWDCLRHYELAANGCVLCFRDLHLKPETCAPHGLNETNCISYTNWTDLKSKLEAITPEKYAVLQQNTYQWVSQQTTIVRAKQLLEKCL